MLSQLSVTGALPCRIPVDSAALREEYPVWAWTSDRICQNLSTVALVSAPAAVPGRLQRPGFGPYQRFLGIASSCQMFDNSQAVFGPGDYHGC